MQLKKSATFRSSKAKKEEQVSFIHSVEKIKDKQ